VRIQVSAVVLGAALCLAASAPAQPASLSQANAALQAGEADKAVALLNSLPATAESHNLRCRVLYTLEHWNAAVDECQKAVDMDGQNSDFHLWLGRALGEKADRASFLSAYSLGRRVLQEFQKAAQLNPRNAAALADLGEFYYSAPGIVGGGTDKAQEVAEELNRVDPARAHELRAHIAETRKDYTGAEREFKLAIAAGSHPAFQWMSLGSFYRRRQQWDPMESAVESGFRAAQNDRKAGVAIYNGATILIRAGRNFDLAAKMLEGYLNSSSKTEEAPAFVACTKLARLEAQLGDKAAARREKDAALALAEEYKPARDLKF